MNIILKDEFLASQWFTLLLQIWWQLISLWTLKQLWKVLYRFLKFSIKNLQYTRLTSLRRSRNEICCTVCPYPAVSYRSYWSNAASNLNVKLLNMSACNEHGLFYVLGIISWLKQAERFGKKKFESFTSFYFY